MMGFEAMMSVMAYTNEEFEAFFMSHNSDMRGLANRVLGGRTDDAYDAVQAAWISIVQHWDQCRDPGKRRGWAMTVAYNAAREIGRRGRLEGEVVNRVSGAPENLDALVGDETGRDMLVTNRSAEVDVDTRRMAACVTNALRMTGCSEAMQRAIDGERFIDLAREYGIGYSAFKSAHFRYMQKIRAIATRRYNKGILNDKEEVQVARPPPTSKGRGRRLGSGGGGADYYIARQAGAN